MTSCHYHMPTLHNGHHPMILVEAVIVLHMTLEKFGRAIEVPGTPFQSGLDAAAAVSKLAGE